MKLYFYIQVFEMCRHYLYWNKLPSGLTTERKPVVTSYSQINDALRSKCREKFLGLSEFDKRVWNGKIISCWERRFHGLGWQFPNLENLPLQSGANSLTSTIFLKSIQVLSSYPLTSDFPPSQSPALVIGGYSRK